MFGWSDLKEYVILTADNVECPVKGCQHTVPRQRNRFKADPGFRCPTHCIFISPTTFQYEQDRENLLWATEDDLALWHCIGAKDVKRDSRRMARDNSEDAVTWNVFRYLEKHGLVGEFVNLVAGGKPAKNPRLVYWSFCQASRKAWQPLLQAARTFGERIARRSEPDLIVDDDDVLAFVENKLTSGNRTKPSEPDNSKRYTTGGDGWFGKVFKATTTFQKIAVEDRLYELMRLWLLGSWIADQAPRKRFLLMNVVRDGKETDIEARFGAHLLPHPQRRFLRVTWEQIYSDIVKPRTGCPDADRLADYFAGKTIGYRLVRRGRRAALRKAFNIARTGHSS